MSLFSFKTRSAANCAAKSAGYATRSAGQDFRQARDETYDRVQSLQHDVSDAAYRGQNRARQIAEDVYGELENTTDQITNTVRSNPLRSLLIMLSAGFVVGALSTKRWK